MANLWTIDRQVWDNTTRERMLATRSSWFAGLAALLAAIGLYAALAYTVSRRIREIHPHGARREHRQPQQAGLRAGWKDGDDWRRVWDCRSNRPRAARKSMLFGVGSVEPAVLAGAAAVIAVVVIAAAIVPAQRAASVNPVEALRAE